jgi:hypothetical protein
MPVSVARKIEYGIENRAPGADVKLDPLVLTSHQVSEYGLPRTPIKESDRRKAGFEAVHGEGAVELDALEALHSGELSRIVEEAIIPFRDTELEGRVREAEAAAQEGLEAHAADILADHESELSSILAEVDAVRERYGDVLREMDSELAPLRARMEALRQAVQNEAEAMRPYLPGLPEGEASEASASESHEWLFGAGRGYFEQLGFYKAHQGKEEE